MARLWPHRPARRTGAASGPARQDAWLSIPWIRPPGRRSDHRTYCTCVSEWARRSASPPCGSGWMFRIRRHCAAAVPLRPGEVPGAPQRHHATRVGFRAASDASVSARYGMRCPVRPAGHERGNARESRCLRARRVGLAAGGTLCAVVRVACPVRRHEGASRTTASSVVLVIQCCQRSGAQPQSFVSRTYSSRLIRRGRRRWPGSIR